MANDQFFDIAARRAAADTRRDGARRNLPALPLQPGGTPGSPRPDPAEDLKAELRRLRSHYEPFAASLAPGEDFVRPHMDLRRWHWKLADGIREFPQAGGKREGWHEVSLPHYAGPVGRARAFYSTTVRATRDLLACPRQRLVFRGADYRAQVYLDGRFVGGHEGFFAPFSIDVTGLLREGADHEVLVELFNDATCLRIKMPDGTESEGDKIYAATGPGWDDPESGWSHCPPGMGLYQEVRLEGCADLAINDLWTRTLDFRTGRIEVVVEVDSALEGPERPMLSVEIFGENFPCEPLKVVQAMPLDPGARRGVNVYRFAAVLPEARCWDLETPWLYRARAVLRTADGACLDARDRVFGVRDFRLETSEEPRGRFYLNGREIRLFGANTMGFEQQDVMRGDLGQLREDLLLAKAGRMNFLRFTQRPVQTEIYDCCDRLGLIAQGDFPLFAGLRRSQHEEALRQAGEMARFLRGHACTGVLTYINEPFPADDRYPSNRYLSRPELEGFFAAADRVLLLHFPDAVIKPVDGDYQPPAPGLPDEHCYNLWYNGHLLDFGALHAGEWPENKAGWNVACGEFGIEGLDPWPLMQSRYPADWLPQNGEDPAAWTPDRIHGAQTGKFHGFFFEAASTPWEWVEKSQRHQKEGIALVTESLRRNPRMVSFAVHLFMDAWPAGWMKALIDCERRPKPAFYAYRQALAPTLGSLRVVRQRVFEGEDIRAEVHVCRNDELSAPEPKTLVYRVIRDGRVLANGRSGTRCPPCTNVVPGVIRWTTPHVSHRTAVEVELDVLGTDDVVLHSTSAAFEVWPAVRSSAGSQAEIVRTPESWLAGRREFLAAVRAGGRCVLLGFPAGTYPLDDGREFRVENCWMFPRHFVARRPQDPLLEDLHEEDFRHWASEEEDRIVPLAATCLTACDGEPVLATIHQNAGGETFNAPVLARWRLGKGEVLVCQLELSRCLSTPTARVMLHRLTAMPDSPTTQPSTAL